MSEDSLPAAHIKRLVKHKLSELMAEHGRDAKGNVPEGHVQKEALAAFNESAKIFIHYLTATANEFCRDGKRQTISVDDVFRAIEETEFEEFIEPLKQAVEGARSLRFSSVCPICVSFKKRSSRALLLPHGALTVYTSWISRASQVSKNAAAKSAKRNERDKKRKSMETSGAGRRATVLSRGGPMNRKTSRRTLTGGLQMKTQTPHDRVTYAGDEGTLRLLWRLRQARTGETVQCKRLVCVPFFSQHSCARHDPTRGRVLR